MILSEVKDFGFCGRPAGITLHIQYSFLTQRIFSSTQSPAYLIYLDGAAGQEFESSGPAAIRPKRNAANTEA